MKRLLIITTMALGIITAYAQPYPYQNPNLSAEQRAEDLLNRLTLKEKALLMMDRSPAIERLGIPQFEWWNEALHGVGRNGYATVFPITMGMAASFNDALVYKVFSAVSDEARAKNKEAKDTDDMKRYRGLSFWTPNINIFRDPRWGRGQETYGEDPYLTTKMGLAVVRGLQGYSYTGEKPASKYAKLFACAKHFAVHSGPEWNRHSFNLENLPERDLWETYLPAFKALVQKGEVKEVMCAYQRIDGEPCCGNTRYLQQILRDEWGFQGLVTSDCGAISDFWKPGYHGFSPSRTDAAARGVFAGTDVECGSDYKTLPEAVAAGKITEEQINTSLKRLLQARFELGDFDADELVDWTKIPMSVVASREHKQIASQIAHESVVLLKNNGVLPLSSSSSSKIVVMGPNANDSTMLWGNYNGNPTETTTILQGIQQYGKNIPFIQGCGLTRQGVLNSVFDHLYTADGTKGLKASYWNNEKMEGEPVAETIIKEHIQLSNGGNTAFAPGVNLEHFSASYDGIYRAEKDEDIQLDILNEDYISIVFNGDTLVKRTNGHGIRPSSYTQRVKAGQQYPIHVEYAHTTNLAFLQFDVVSSEELTHQQILRQIDDAETVIFVGGISPRLEGEEMKVNEEGFKGGDRTSIELPKVQREMLAMLKKAGKKVIYVNCSGSAIGMLPENTSCDAIIQAWYGGEKGGEAVADVIFGKYNPSGKLPVTFYEGDHQLSQDYEDYTMRDRTYRYYKGKPLFPFGHGLSYTTFQFGKPKYKNGKLTVSISNTGSREGSEVVQVYIRNLQDTEGPLKTLRAYKRVQLHAGETQQVEIDLPRECFEFWDTTTNTMRIKSGKYELMVGNSSADNNLQRIKINTKF